MTPIANHYEQFDRQEFRVKLRRGDGWDVKPNAEAIDGHVYLFQNVWIIEEGIYAGETAWSPMRDKGYPHEGPAWVASGDLEEIQQEPK